MIDWNNIIERSHGMAKEKGWWDEPCSVQECLMLAVTEIAGAVEWYRENPEYTFEPYRFDAVCATSVREYRLRGEVAGWKSWKPVGIPSELADVCIRVCDLMGRSNYAANCVDRFGNEFGDSSFVTQCFWLTNKIATVVPDDEGRMKNEDWHQYVNVGLCGALACVRDIAKIQDIDLAAAIETKLAYNATRPQRHGGKRA